MSPNFRCLTLVRCCNTEANGCKVTFVSTQLIGPPPGRRQRNPRGEGARLRAEILQAASTLLDETGDESAVTLRAIARTAGIAAPSIYTHFPDREAVLDPVERLYAGCRAYLAFAAERPERYQLIFHQFKAKSRQREIDPEARAQGMIALGLLVQGVAECAQAGRSASTDPFADAVSVWAALHGLATLLANIPQDFPWPDTEDMLNAVVGRIARIGP